MPPDDPLAGQAPKTETTTPPTPEPGMTEDRLGEVMYQSFQKAVAPITERLERLEKTYQRPPESKAAPEPASGDPKLALAERLLVDPEAVINEIGEKHLQSRLGPHFQALIPTIQRTLLSDERRTIDDYYGTGTFDEEIQPELGKLMEQVPESARMSADGISKLVAMVRGGQKVQEKLAAKREKLLKDKNEAAATHRREPPGFLGAGVGSLGGDLDTLSDEDRAALKKIREVDPSFTEERVLQLRKKSGTRHAGTVTREDWLKSREKKKVESR